MPSVPVTITEVMTWSGSGLRQTSRTGRNSSLAKRLQRADISRERGQNV
jgi:hypothetical protein